MVPRPSKPSSSRAAAAIDRSSRAALCSSLNADRSRSRRAGSIVAGLLSVLVVSAAVGQLSSDPTGNSANASATHVILLRNGRVIEGQATREPDRWSIRIGSGSRIRMELDQVDLIASDYRDVRRQLQARTSRDQISARVEIARFCMKHDLFDEAQEEIDWLIADGIEPAAGQRLTDQLATARRLAVERAAPRLSAADRAISVAASDRSDFQGEGELEAENDGERGASGRAEPIDQDAFSVFIRRIQPPMIAGCAAARCHGPQGTTDFQLQRLELGSQPTRRMSEANYREVRRWALTAPEGNTLVDLSLRAHGGRREAVWLHSEAKADELRAWLEWMRQIEPTMPVAIAGNGSGRASSDGRAAADSSMSGSPDLGPDQVRPVSYDGSNGNDVAIPDRLRRPPISSGDPYDPEIFRRYMQWKNSVVPQGDEPPIDEPPGDQLPQE